MTKRLLLDAGQVEVALDTLVDLIVGVAADPKKGRATAKPGLRQLHRELRARVEADRPDGYPTSSGLDQRGDPSTEYDDEVDPITGEVRSYPMPRRSDPTANAVARRDTDDVVSAALEAVVNGVHNAVRLLVIAESRGMQASPPVVVPPDPEGIWCTSCLRANVHTPLAESAKSRDTLCGWCYGWRLARHEGHDLPPVELIDRRSRGGRITSRDVDEILALPKYRTSRKKGVAA